MAKGVLWGKRAVHLMIAPGQSGGEGATRVRVQHAARGRLAHKKLLLASEEASRIASLIYNMLCPFFAALSSDKPSPA